ncbi:MAG: efflux RND transporter permease subunit [Acidobacteriota bacterium]
MNIPEFSVKKKVTTTMLILIVVVVGIISFTNLGLDLFPDIEFPQVSIITQYQGVSSEDMESLITKPIEGWVSSVTNVKKVRSISQEGLSLIMVDFEWGTNLDFAAQDIRERIGLFKKFLPENASDPLVLKFNMADFPVLFYGITGEMDERDLQKLIEKNVAERLERIDGVASAQAFSSKLREINILINKFAMESRLLTLDQIINSLRLENLNLPAGFIKENHHEYVLRTLGEFNNLEDIKKTIVGISQEGKPTYLGDVAAVEDGYRESRYIARIMRKSGVVMFIQKNSGANTVKIVNEVNKKLEEIKKTLPENVKFHVVMDFSEFIKLMASRTTSNALVGGLLAISFILLFLRNWRPTLIIGLAIPLSIIATFIAFYLAGYTLNLFTLIGLALGVGMMVDNSIVVIENTFRHLEEGKPREKAAIFGASEVGMAITASTLTTIGVFFPMVFGTGLVGKLSRSLALSISFSLFSSLFVAITIVPMLASVLFKKEIKPEEYERKFGEKQFIRMKKFYSKLLEKVLKNKLKVLGGVLILFIISILLVLVVGTEFMPKVDRSMLFLKIKLPVGTNIDETDRVVSEMEIKSLKEKTIETLIAEVGVNEQDIGYSEFTPSGPHEGSLFVRLISREQRDLSAEEILEKLRNKIPHFRNVEMEAIDLGTMFMGGSMSPIEINIYGEDIPVLQRYSELIRTKLEGIKELRDIKVSMEEGKPEFRIRIDREKASRLGLKVAYVASVLETSTLGKLSTRYKSGGEEIDVRVKLREEDRNNIREILTLPIMTPFGKKIYLSEVAYLEKSEGPVRIERENQVRKIAIQSNYIGGSLGKIVKEIKKRVEPIEKTLPFGYFIEYGGQYDDMIEAFKTMVWVFLLATLITYMIMAAQFESFTQSFIIMFTIPLSLIGVVLGLLIAGRNINLPVLMGYVMLAGIAVNNGIVMIDYINRLRRSGMKKFDAIVHGASVRLRPILITSFTTILGTVPMVFSRSEGSEMRVPLGLTIGSGLLTTTLLTLFILPIVYDLFTREFKRKEE